MNSKQYRFTPKQVADNLLLLARHYEAVGCGKESGFACPASDAAAVLFAAERLIPKWVSVSDLLPEEDVDVLVMTNYGMHVADLDEDGLWNASHGDSWQFPEPTHWMLLPVPPPEAT